MNEESAPWEREESIVRAMPIILRVERHTPVHHQDALEASATAVAALLGSEDAWHEGHGLHRAVAEWRSGRVRKVVRRARGSQWENAAGELGATATIGSASAHAAWPCEIEATPQAIHRLQVSGLELTGKLERIHGEDSGVLIVMNPAVHASTGKLAAQAGHGSGLLLEQMSASERARWCAQDWRLRVLTSTEDEFGHLARKAAVVVHDAGFTEVPPGTLTCITLMR